MTAMGLAIWNFLIDLFVTLLNIVAAISVGVLVIAFIMAAIYQMREEAKKNV